MKLGDLRVWHIPQVPGKPFHVAVPSIDVAKIVLDALADYDLFQLENNIKPDYANVQGLEMVEMCDHVLDWCEWWSEDCEDIHKYEVPS